MFQPGEYVVYGCKGIHRIMDITTLDMDGVSKDKKYYVMQPCGKQEGSVYAPVYAQKINMRLVMTKDEANAFLSTMDAIAPLDIKSNKQREEAYKECIRSCDPDELMRVIKTLYRRKQSRKAAGKKLTLTDLHYLTQAETILYTELSLALGKSLEEMPDYIQSLVDQELVK